MKKILTVVGARPQFVKLGPLSKEIRKEFEEIIVHTGQHFDDSMSKTFFEDLNIPKPDYNLGVHSKSNDEQVKEVMEKLDQIIIKEKPGLVVVYGDTNATLAGAKIAKKHNIPIAHVEAGMRSYNDMPEEKNRVLTDAISTLFFCSTKKAIENLKKEGITKDVFLVGDVMIDALVDNITIAEKNSDILTDFNLKPNNYLLTTIHRSQNTDSEKNLRSIFEALEKSQKKIILPLHPRTKKFIEDYDISIGSNILLIPPASYLDMLILEKNAEKIITDSGGIQKEAYFFNIPCITLREVTEWTETVEEGFNVLVDTDKSLIIEAISNFDITRKSSNIYGTGDASKKIAEKIKEFLD